MPPSRTAGAGIASTAAGHYVRLMHRPDPQDFAHVSVWIFDLDNTLYPAADALFPQISARMSAWLVRNLRVSEAEAARLRDHYWRHHGTTLAGLMAEHGIDPHPFLDDVHDVDLTRLRPDPVLARALDRLPGRKIIHTNADAAYAGRVLAARGLSGFDAVLGIGETGWHPKPDQRAYDAIRAAVGFDPREAAMFEDAPRNLAVPFAQGMRTVLVGSGEDGPDNRPMPPEAAAHLTHRTLDLSGFLDALAQGLPACQSGGQPLPPNP